MRTFIFAVVAIVPVSCAIDQAWPLTEYPPSILSETAMRKWQVAAPKSRTARKTKQMPRMSWPNARLNLERQRSKPASGRAALEADSAMSSY
jgi:hypothetical protein